MAGWVRLGLGQFEAFTMQGGPMTTERRKRTKKRGGRFVTDAELIERLGVPERIAYVTLHGLDQNPRSGFPKKQALWGNRRDWDAIELWLDKNSGMIPMESRRSA
jgi:hypothetical protein